MSKAVALVLVKFKTGGKLYLYEAPKFCSISEGDLVKVEGKNNLIEIGTVNSVINYVDIDSDEYKMIVELAGALEPLSKIQTRYTEHEIEYEEEV